MNILNETPFLAEVETTPTFLVFDSKLSKYKTVSLTNKNNSDEELVFEDQDLASVLS